MTLAERVMEAMKEAAETGDVRPERIVEISGCSLRTAQRHVQRWNSKNVTRCRLLLKNIRT